MLEKSFNPSYPCTLMAGSIYIAESALYSWTKILPALKRILNRLLLNICS